MPSVQDKVMSFLFGKEAEESDKLSSGTIMKCTEYANKEANKVSKELKSLGRSSKESIAGSQKAWDEARSNCLANPDLAN